MRWILIFAIFTIGLGIYLHEGGEIPWPYMGWVGRLPGDLIITKNGIDIYLPLTSCLLASFALSFIASLFRK